MRLIEARKIERQKGYFRETNVLLSDLGSRQKVRFQDEQINISFDKVFTGAINRAVKVFSTRK